MNAMEHDPGLWDEWIDGWVRDAPLSSCRTTTIDHYRARVRAFAKFAALAPDEVGADDVIAWVERPGPSPNTRNRDRGILASFFQWTCLKELRDDPMPLVPAIGRSTTCPRIASEEEIDQGRRHWDARTQIMVALAGDAGLRRGEIAALQGSDLVRQSDGWTLVVPGDGPQRRTVPVADNLARMIERRGDGYTFPGEKGCDHVCEDTVWRIIKEATGCPPAALRRRFAVVALCRTDGDSLMVADLMGLSADSVLELVRTGRSDDSGSIIRSGTR